MGKPNSKVVDPNANVVNEVVVENNNNSEDLYMIKIYTLLITIILSINFVISVYGLHNKKLKKRYMSKATDLDRV